LEAVLEGQPIWADHGRPNPELVWTLLGVTGLDIERARKDMNDPKILARLKQDAADIVKLDVRKTPTLFINGKPLREFSPETWRHRLPVRFATQTLSGCERKNHEEA
jgi:hypothetical protein